MKTTQAGYQAASRVIWIANSVPLLQMSPALRPVMFDCVQWS